MEQPKRKCVDFILNMMLSHFCVDSAPELKGRIHRDDWILRLIEHLQPSPEFTAKFMAWQKHQLEWQQKHHSCNIFADSLGAFVWWLYLFAVNSWWPSWWGKIFGKWSLRNRRMRLRCEENLWDDSLVMQKRAVFAIAIWIAKSCPQHLTAVSLTKATKQSSKYCRKLMLLRIHSFVSEETRPTESGRKICLPAGGRGKRKFGHFLGGGLDAGHICGR